MGRRTCCSVAVPSLSMITSFSSSVILCFSLRITALSSSSSLRLVNKMDRVLTGFPSKTRFTLEYIIFSQWHGITLGVIAAPGSVHDAGNPLWEPAGGDGLPDVLLLSWQSGNHGCKAVTSCMWHIHTYIHTFIHTYIHAYKINSFELCFWSWIHNWMIFSDYFQYSIIHIQMRL